LGNNFVITIFYRVLDLVFWGQAVRNNPGLIQPYIAGRIICDGSQQGRRRKRQLSPNGEYYTVGKCMEAA